MISVVIPAFNAARWLPESLESVFAQTIQPDEVVVVDDGSTDDTLAVLERYRGRIRVIAADHGGLSATRNRCLEHATGDLIAFQDADDIALPDRLEVLRRHLDTHPHLDGILANGVRLDGNAPVIGPGLASRVSGRALTAADLFVGFPVYFQGALISRDAFARAGTFDLEFPVHPDHDYAFRLFARCRIQYLDRVVFRYRQHEANMSSNQLGARIDLASTLERVRRHDPAVVALIGSRRLDAALARHHYRIGRTQLRRGDVRAAQRAFDRAIALRPFRPAYRWQRWLAARRAIEHGADTPTRST